jgi:hypothetical protein
MHMQMKQMQKVRMKAVTTSQTHHGTPLFSVSDDVDALSTPTEVDDEVDVFELDVDEEVSDSELLVVILPSVTSSFTIYPPTCKSEIP